MLGSALLPYHTRRSSQQNIRRFSCSFVEANNIGIICSYHALINDTVIEEFIELLKDEGKKVSLLVFHEDSSQTSQVDSNSFSKRDLNFFGYWKNDHVKVFMDKEFDFLLYLDIDYNPFISNVIAKSKAHCRMGIYQEEPKPFLELMIKPENKSIGGLIDETYNYLGKIRNND